MKNKKYFVFPFLLFITITILIYPRIQVKQLQNQFLLWETGKVNEAEKVEIIDRFTSFVSKKNNINDAQLIEICKQLKTIESGNLSIIEYIENPNYYGRSSKLSYQIAVSDGVTKILAQEGSIQIEEVCQISETSFILYFYDYRFSNKKGIRIGRVDIIDNYIQYTDNIIATEHPTEFQSINGVLYFSHQDLSIMEIHERGNYIIIGNDDTKFKLLYADGLYTCL